MATVTGRTTGLQVLAQSDLNNLRSVVFDASQYANVYRGGTSLDHTFRQVLPPVVNTGPIRTGCGTIDDPTCLTTFTFNTKVTTLNEINEIVAPCDAEGLGSLMDHYLAEGSIALGNKEATQTLEYLAAETTEMTPVTVNNKKEEILKAVNQLEKKLVAEMGKLAPTRSIFKVFVSQDVEDELTALNLACCQLPDQLKSPTTNYFRVNSVTAVPFAFMPEDVEFMVYVPNFLFIRTMCKSPFGMEVLSDASYERGTRRFYGADKIGFDRFSYLLRGQTVPFEPTLGIKKTVTPPVIP